MLYWTQEFAPPIQEFQLLGEHNLPTSSLYRAHCKWLSRPVRNNRDLTAQYQDQPTPLTHSCYCMPLKRACLYIFYNFLSVNCTHGYDPLNLLFSGLNTPSSFTISMDETCSSPSITSVALHWICSRTCYLSCTLTCSQPHLSPALLMSQQCWVLK